MSNIVGSLQDRYDIYIANGGTKSFDEWLNS